MVGKTITLPWPDRDLQSNARVNRGKRIRLTKQARSLAWSVAMEVPRVECMPDAQIFIEYYPKSYRGDVHNVPSSLKAYIDGIADAMGCDDKGFKIDYPNQWAGKSKRGEVVFRILPRGAGQAMTDAQHLHILRQRLLDVDSALQHGQEGMAIAMLRELIEEAKRAFSK